MMNEDLKKDFKILIALMVIISIIGCIAHGYYTDIEEKRELITRLIKEGKIDAKGNII